MAVKVHWDNNEHTIIRWEMTGRWTNDELFGALQDASTLARSVDHKVYALCINQGVTPSDLLDIGARLAPHWPDNLSRLLFVGAGGALRNAFSIFGRAYQSMPRVEFLDSLHEAYERITLLVLKEVYIDS